MKKTVKSLAELESLAGDFLKKLKKGKQATLVTLAGDLGSGKTAFTQGFIKSLGIKTHVPSPTFVIYRRYPIYLKLKIKNLKFSNIYHFDLYRVIKPKEIIDLDFKKILKNPENIVLIEWPEVIKKYLPKDAIRVELEHGKKPSERKIKIL